MNDDRRSNRGPMLAGLVLVLVTAACYEHTVEVGAGAPHAPVVYDHWENFWLGGLIGHVKVAVEDMCPSGDAVPRVGARRASEPTGGGGRRAGSTGRALGRPTWAPERGRTTEAAPPGPRRSASHRV